MLGTLNLEEAARKAAGNWRDFNSFVWFRDRELEDSEQWAIIYTSHRDSTLLDQSNAAAITEAMEPFTEGDDPDLVFESHSHWAVGHIEGFSLRVFDQNGEITPAFRAYHEFAERLADYPVLDDEDYSRRGYEATLENIADAACKVKQEYVLPDGWESEAYSWLSDNDPSEIEDKDDRGGYPSEESLRAAFDALGFEKEPE